MQQTAEVLAFARSKELPVPRQEAVVAIDDGSLAVVQERLDGRPSARVDAAVIDATVAVNERFAGLLADRPDVPIPPMWLRESAPVFPRHELLATHSDRSRRLLERIRAIGALEPHEMTGDDLVHPDFTFRNVLYDCDGHVSGVVDWNWGVGRGTAGSRWYGSVSTCGGARSDPTAGSTAYSSRRSTGSTRYYRK
nr:aminoglycoside phosphotransferase family protein [Actinopolymorpha rutila]